MELTPKAAMATTSRTLARSLELVQHRSHTYIPVNYQTQDFGPCPAEYMVWVPMSRDDKRGMANKLGNVLFSSDSEITSFDLMLRQWATQVDKPVERLLIKTPQGLKMLDEYGDLEPPTGTFLPNFIRPELNEDPELKEMVFNTIAGWLSSTEEATSLLHHLATSLAPGWTAVKYVLLLGDGRNGKSVLLKMLADLFGPENVSGITRQQMAEGLPTLTELNGKLLNIVMDGKMAYIKDSSMEKTLIAGEKAYVRLLYENGNTPVQTNALFLEALNTEPKSRDKSSALQKRLSRFWFPNVYALDHRFEKRMRSEPVLGAFLSLLLDHFIQEDEIAEKLKQTESAQSMQVEQQLLNSPLLQYVQHLVSQDPVWIEKFRRRAGEKGPQLQPLVASFMAWRAQEGYSMFSSADVQKMFRENFNIHRESYRDAQSKIQKRPLLAGPKGEVEMLLKQLEGDEDDGLLEEALVAN